MADVTKVSSGAVLALGLGQALVPQVTARVFGLRELDGQAVWLARLVGTSNVALGAMGLDDDLADAVLPHTHAIMGGMAAATVVSGITGGIPKRSAALVLGFLAALAVADASSRR
jgi:hypothetical protein